MGINFWFLSSVQTIHALMTDENIKVKLGFFFPIFLFWQDLSLYWMSWICISFKFYWICAIFFLLPNSRIPNSPSSSFFVFSSFHQISSYNENWIECSIFQSRSCFDTCFLIDYMLLNQSPGYNWKFEMWAWISDFWTLCTYYILVRHWSEYQK